MEQAEKECLADAEPREVRRQRDAQRREVKERPHPYSLSYLPDPGLGPLDPLHYLTGSVSNRKAAFSNLFLRAFSSPSDSFGFPSGCVIPAPWTMRFAPTVCAVGTRVVIRTVGMPAFSISLVSTAPQRVPVPQVAVNMTPETRCALSSSAMALPIFLPLAMVVATPVVTK